MTKKRRTKAQCTSTPAAHMDGRFECGTLSVDNPEITGRAIKVQANIRHDVLVHWRARKQIDDVQFLAGQRLQTLWYRAGTGRPSALCYGRDRVDGGLRADPFSEQVAAASMELRQVAAFLGRADYSLTTRALCEGRAIDDLAREFEGREPQRYIARRLRDALSYLGDFWGTTGARMPRPVSSPPDGQPRHATM